MAKQRRPVFAETLEARILMSSYVLSDPLLANVSGQIGIGDVIADSAGNVYGTVTTANGATDIFEVAAGTHTMTTLASIDETYVGDLMVDSQGNIYGATGSNNYTVSSVSSVFEIAAGSHQFQTLATIPSEDGIGPAGLVLDSSGNIYGITYESSLLGNATLFKIAEGTHQFSVVVNFEFVFDGIQAPYPCLAVDGAGNIYGLASQTGDTNNLMVYEVPAGSNTPDVLQTIPASEASWPNAGLVVDAQGNLYGTTQNGGYGWTGNQLSGDAPSEPTGDGTIFEIAAGTHQFSVLAQFDGTNGSEPYGGLAIDSNGDLFGTTQFSGSIATDGSVFELPAGSQTITTIAWFNSTDEPAGDFSVDSNGNLYGSSGAGVFELSPQATAANKLVFIDQPAGGFDSISRYQAMPPITVAIEDANGNVDTDFNGLVTLGIESGPSGAVLGGTLTVAAVNGLATFTFIAEATPGKYTLDASSAGFVANSGVSASFSVTGISSIDEANMNVISGWVFDPNNPSAELNIEIDILGGLSQTISADLDRPDITSVTAGYADHGFTYTTPMLSTGDHTAYVYAILSDGSKVLIGTETLVSQNSLFDEHYYLEKYPNVAAAVAAGQYATGYDQYVKYGQYEGYSPSPFWNETWYLLENPDVSLAVVTGKVSSGFMQYYLYGQYENRGGLLYFNSGYYLSLYSNIGAAISAGTVTSAYEHYVDFGQYEGYSPMIYFLPAVYDADNQDIAPYVSGEPFTSDFEQFLEYGQFEGRVASYYYNEQTYLANNADVAAAVEAGVFADGFIQWLEYGQYEGRISV